MIRLPSSGALRPRAALRRFGPACLLWALSGGCRAPAAVPCVSMDAPSALVTAAAMFRVDVYPTASHCTDPGGPAGSPVLTRSFTQGQALAFHADAGRRPVVLISFADVAAKIELGRACTEADLGQGQAVCLDLQLAATPDLATPVAMSCEVGGPPVCGAMTCCDSLCWDTTGDVAHCGGCRACGASNVATPSCEAGLCSSSCTAGYGNCVQPAAPAADDGCETDLNTSVGSCGACARACSALNTTATSCAGGLCTSTCASGYGNCVQPAAPAADDGCETSIASSITSCGACARACAATHVDTASCAGGLCTSSCASGFLNCAKPLAPAADDGCECAGTACCGTSCQTSHADGLGQSFLDCVALNTHDLTQATAARTAWGMVSTSDFTDTSSCGDGTPMVCRQTAASCACWGYSAGVAKPGTGHVHLNNASNGCMCPGAGDATWN